MLFRYGGKNMRFRDRSNEESLPQSTAHSWTGRAEPGKFLKSLQKVLVDGGFFVANRMLLFLV